MKIIFMGTPEFAVTILEKLITQHEVVLVVTQPDKRVGRKQRIEFSPVKEFALENNLEVFQPLNIRKEEDYIKSFDADIIVTAAYGQIIGKGLLEYFPYKSINVHGSLLPQYRGGAPIQRAIINGEQETGITIMYMSPKMDAGDILAQEKLAILDSDNQETLFKKMALLGSEMILDVLDDIQEGNVNPIVQDEALVSYAYNLTKEDELIDFNKSSREVFNQIRGLDPNPGAYTLVDGQVLKVYQSQVSEVKTTELPGVIIKVERDFFTISCGDNSAIDILEVQLAGRNKMNSRDFLNGIGRKLITSGKSLGGKQ